MPPAPHAKPGPDAPNPLSQTLKQETNPPSGTSAGEGEDENETKIITVTGVDLSTLPFSMEQIKEAVFELERQIQLEAQTD